MSLALKLMTNADLSQLEVHLDLQRIIFMGGAQKYHLDLALKSPKTFIRALTLLAALATTLGFWSSCLLAQTQTQIQVQIYGSKLMTDAERAEFQTKMSSLKTDKERDALRLDQIKKMNLQATKKGITLQYVPAAVGTGPKSNAGVGGGSTNSSGRGGKGSGR